MTAAASHDGVTSVSPCPGCVLCATLSTWLDSTPLIVPCAPPVAPVDLSELRVDLIPYSALAARLVREGRREYADTIVADLRHTDASLVTIAQVKAWGEGRDAAIVASNLAWRGDADSNGCEACALRALDSGDAATRCKDCRAEVCA